MGCREWGVILFQKLGEFLEGLAGLGDGRWAFEESEGFVGVPFLEEVRYACYALSVALSLLSLDLLGGRGSRISAWCSRAAGLLFH